MRAFLLATLLVAASQLTQAVHCPVKNDPLVIASANYVSCKNTAGIDFATTGKVALDPILFCSQGGCFALWQQLRRLGCLQCLQEYDRGDYQLSQESSAMECFAKYNESVIPVTKATEAASWNARDDIASSTPPTNLKASSSQTAIPRCAASWPSLLKAAKALTQDAWMASTRSLTTLTRWLRQDPKKEVVVTSGMQEATPSSPTSASANADAIISGATPANETDSSTPSTPSPEPSADPSSSTSSVPDRHFSVVWIVMCGGVAMVVLMAIWLVYNRCPTRNRPVRVKAVGDLDTEADYFDELRSSTPGRSNSGSISILESSGISSQAAVWGDDETIDAIRIPYEKITIGALISRGGFGEVYRGMYRDEAVAIKTLLPERRQDMGQIRNFFAEIKLMAVLEHEHIVRLVGVAWESLHDLCVVSEFLERGDLGVLLAEYAEQPSVFPRGFTNVNKIKIALHVTQALAYMHSFEPMVLHRDLKSRNILLDINLDAKITDFGVSRERVDDTMTVGVGSILWMAPEVMTGGRYDDKADVFSFGVVLSELDTHMLPYSHAMEPGFRRRLPDAVVIRMMVSGRLTAEFTDKSPMAQLGRWCVSLDPRERPTAAQVLHEIQQIWGDSLASSEA